MSIGVDGAAGASGQGHFARRVAAVLVGLAAVGWALPAPGVPGTDAKSLTLHAAEVFARDVRGFVRCRSTFEGRIEATVFKRNFVSHSIVVLHDGTLVFSRIESLVEDGKPASREEVERRQAKTDASRKDGNGFFKPPYDRRYLDDYTLAVDTSRDQPAGRTTLKFTSALKDTSHGSGSFTLDDAFRVREVRFTPNVRPPMVSVASIRVERGDVGDGYFGALSLQGNYEGGSGPLKGGMRFVQRFDRYQRFRSLEEALRP